MVALKRHRRRPAVAIVASERRGFTLVEILLALALIVALASIAWPMLFSSLDSERLRSAAEHVQTAWTEARVAAMSSGTIHLFEYEPESGRYVVTPWDDFSSAGAADGLSDAETVNLADGQQRRLPEGVKFAAVQQVVDARAESLGVGASGATSGSQAPPVVFYPDGTTTTVELILISDRDSTIRVSLRGLTGVVRVGGVDDDPPEATP